MIYLIDDKNKRQSDYGWNLERLDKYKEIITPIYNSNELLNLRYKIFSNEMSAVLLHESFFNTVTNTHSKSSLEIRKDLKNLALKENEFLYADFSGSKVSTYLENNIASLRVSTMYNNLNSFILKYIQGDRNLKYLVFGENPEIEEILNLKRNIHRKLFSKIDNSEAVSSIKVEIDRLSELGIPLSELEINLQTSKKIIDG